MDKKKIIGGVVGIFIVIIIGVSLFESATLDRQQILNAFDGYEGKVTDASFATLGAKDGFDYRAVKSSIEVYVFATENEAQEKAKGLPDRKHKFVHKNLVVFIHHGDAAEIKKLIQSL